MLLMFPLNKNECGTVYAFDGQTLQEGMSGESGPAQSSSPADDKWREWCHVGEVVSVMFEDAKWYSGHVTFVDGEMVSFSTAPCLRIQNVFFFLSSLFMVN